MIVLSVIHFSIECEFPYISTNMFCANVSDSHLYNLILWSPPPLPVRDIGEMMNRGGEKTAVGAISGIYTISRMYKTTYMYCM
jgi:hypothetical protein